MTEAQEFQEDTASLPGSVKRAIFEAGQLEGAGEYAKGAGLLRKFLDEHPEHDGPILRLHLGIALRRADRPEESLPHFEEAVGQEPKYVRAWLALAEASYDLGRYDRAAEAFHAAFSAGTEKKPVLLYYAGASALMADNAGQAYRYLSRLVSGDLGSPELEWCRAFVAAAIDADRREASDLLLRQWVSHHPDDPEGWRLVYQASGGLGDYRKAAIALTVIDYLDPLPAPELVQLGDLCLNLEIPARAASYYERALHDTAGAGIQERLASAYLAAHRTSEALEFLNQAVKRSPTQRLWLLLGDLHYTEERYDRALEAFRAASGMEPASGRAHLMMGYCAYQLDRREEARRHALAAAGYPDSRDSALRFQRLLDSGPR